MKKNMSSVLACVTDQYNCDRIIRTARQIADDYDCELRVLSVIRPTRNYAAISDRIEYLYNVAKESDADMTILFEENAAKATAEFVRKNGVKRIVTGMHDGGDNSFLVVFNRLAPLVPITMVSENNMVYTMELCNSHS